MSASVLAVGVTTAAMFTGLTAAHADATVTKTIVVGDGPVEVAFTPDGTQAYVSNGGNSSVSVIATGLSSASKQVSVAGPATVFPATNSAFLITGTAPAKATVTLHFHKAGTAAADYSITRSVIALGEGSWSRTITANTDYRYFATAAGAISGSVLFQPAPTVSGESTRVGAYGKTYTLTGSAMPGSTVVLHFHKQGMAATDYSIVRAVTADAAGNWQRSYVATTDYRLYASLSTDHDGSEGPHYLLQAR